MPTDQHAVVGNQAANDDAVMNGWVARFQKRPHTARIYRREISRLRLFMAREGVTLRAFTVEHRQRYVEFLLRPPEDLIGPRRPRSSPTWKPFTGCMNGGSLKHAISVIAIFFKYAKERGYIESDPMLGGIDLPEVDAPPARADRYFDDRQLQILTDAIRRVGEGIRWNRGAARWKFERNRWIFHLLLHTDLKRAQACGARMSDLQLQYIDGGDQWMLSVPNRSGSPVLLPVGEGAIEALVRFRRFMQLPELPERGETLPLVPLESGPDARPLSETGMYQALRTLLDRALEFVPASETHLRERVRQATPNWMRHSFATTKAAINRPAPSVPAGADAREVREDFTHAGAVDPE
ncbi:tyrosine-type recombinase/integrase [Burkholderia sp. MBR-1]|uniref:tyrosine-type recombinase/integrase n=1 Tax=Burkholderia sp. MBR-1 TaxID=2732364 RepID=UPI0015EF87A0|nr:hypothetical protein [Burkholderia sp. MBR-1]QMI49697.1 hypothetical protein MBR110_29885 [Burkholderia sp. MBR-1]